MRDPVPHTCIDVSLPAVKSVRLSTRNLTYAGTFNVASLLLGDALHYVAEGKGGIR
jgi:hypothetical protein